MKQVKFVTAVIAGLIFGGCSSHQDPLAEKADAIRAATQPPPPVKKPTAMESDLVKIDVDSQVGVLEGTAVKLHVGLRILQADYDKMTLTIENMNEFPGAQFDPVTGDFAWTPDFGYTESQYSRQVMLKIRAFADSTKSEKVPLTRLAGVTILVTKNPQDPLIRGVKGLESVVREGDRVYFHVTVSNPDNNLDSAHPPKLIFLGPKNSYVKSLAPSTAVDRVEYLAAQGLWDFTCVLDLDGEFTDSSNAVGLYIVAVSGFGRFSAEYRYEGHILTSLSIAEVTLPTKYSLNPGVENKIQFIVYDPKGEGVLSLESANVSSGGKISCNRGALDKSLQCELVVTPPGKVGEETDLRVEIDVNARNQDSADSYVRRSSFYRTYRVKALPPPPPPTPTPTPNPENVGGLR